MSRMRRSTALLTLGAVLAIGLSAGCSKKSEIPTGACAAPSSLVYVVQATDNAPTPYLHSATEGTLDAALECGAPVSVVEADGAPHALLAQGRVDPTSKLSSAEKRDQRTLLYNEVVARINAAKPSADGVDMFAALGLAGTLSSGPTPVVVIMGPGLSDRGSYTITDEGMSLTSAETVMHQLTPADLPKLSNATVRWYWLWQGVGDQKPLAPRQTATIEAVYAAIIKAAGGTLTVEAGAPGGRSPEVAAGAFTVTPVAPQHVTVAPDPGSGTGVDVFDGASQLAFQKNVAVFLDPVKARETAIAYAAWLTAHPRGRLHIVGTTASFGTPAELKTLSEKRAAAFRNLIIAQGADGTRITFEGLGNWFPEFRQDMDARGREIPDAARANRSVRIQRVLG